MGLSARARGLGLGLLLCVVAASARAQIQTASQQQCTLALNKRVRAVALARAKDALGCLKDGAKGTLAGPVDACVTGDRKGKIAAATAKTLDEFAKRCAGASLPPWDRPTPTD